MNIVAEYIKYWMKSKKRHGIHSPFIYEISDYLSQKSINSDFKKRRNNLYKKLSLDKRQIIINDFGAGSKKMNHSRKVCDIFKNSSSRGKTADYLYKLSSFHQPKRILEFGTSLGVGTIHLINGSPGSEITSVEACENTLDIAKENLVNDQVHFYCSSFDDYIQNNISGLFDLIYIDGHHDGDALLTYINKLLPFSSEETMFIIDDIRWSNSMNRAWKKVQLSQEFNVTVDLFRFGLAFRRSHQQKENFILR